MATTTWFFDGIRANGWTVDLTEMELGPRAKSYLRCEGSGTDAAKRRWIRDLAEAAAAGLRVR